MLDEEYDFDFDFAFLPIIASIPAIARPPQGGRGGRCGAAGKTNVEDLKKAGVNAVYYESPLTAHEWLSWGRDLHEFAPLLFHGMRKDERRRAGSRDTSEP